MLGFLLPVGAFLAVLFGSKQAQGSTGGEKSLVQKIFGPFQAFGPFLPANTWYASKVIGVAQNYNILYGFNIDPVMVAAIVKNESSFDPKAYRYEPHIDDASYGLMQTLLKTAQWMHDIGYVAFPRPSGESLYDGNTSIYFGMAYLHYLSRYRGKKRDERFIIESYNGGPGNTNRQTADYYEKYTNAKTEVA